jgi:hypothetical protein
MKLLTKLIRIPSFTMEEHLMTAFLEGYCKKQGYAVKVDSLGNVFVTKGKAEIYPSVTAHMDTVFPAPPAQVMEQNGCIFGLDKKGNRCGVGGDDKAGVWICLQLLEQLDVLKCAYYIGEESFTYGSTNSSNDFFKDVSYCLALILPAGTSLLTLAAVCACSKMRGNSLTPHGESLVLVGILRCKGIRIQTLCELGSAILFSASISAAVTSTFIAPRNSSSLPA